MLAARVENGAVTNISRAADGQDLPAGWVEAPAGVGIGFAYDGQSFTPPPPPVTTEQRLEAWRAQCVLTRLEFAVALRMAGILTQAEALEFVTYQLPAPITAMIAGLSVEYQGDATMLMVGAQEFPRMHPMWDLFAASPGGLSAAQIDGVFGWTG